MNSPDLDLSFAALGNENGSMLVEIRCVLTHTLVRERGSALVQLACQSLPVLKVRFDARLC
jgi:hypothetical protein